ncbi:uncharacterized protein LOC133190648 [Saccostrea echinata]|uniref:uncharacterized protein LOC133190648 n=1 Tax=Saccostrea echinata TaxID=191078 RepID=UPI002A81EC73|nr:uncharacterized protein LOC133190648 [Saccostrea echinata]
MVQQTDDPAISLKSDRRRSSSGLTSFEYSGLIISPDRVQHGKLKNVKVTFTITNTGQRDGDEIAELYISWQNATADTPIQKLVGFQRYGIKSGASVTGHFTIYPHQMALYVKGKGRIVKPGAIVVYVGDQLPQKQGGSKVINGTFVIYNGDTSNSGYRLFPDKIWIAQLLIFIYAYVTLCN